MFLMILDILFAYSRGARFLVAVRLCCVFAPFSPRPGALGHLALWNIGTVLAIVAEARKRATT